MSWRSRAADPPASEFLAAALIAPLTPLSWPPSPASVTPSLPGAGTGACRAQAPGLAGRFRIDHGGERGPSGVWHRRAAAARPACQVRRISSTFAVLRQAIPPTDARLASAAVMGWCSPVRSVKSGPGRVERPGGKTASPGPASSGSGSVLTAGAASGRADAMRGEPDLPLHGLSCP